MVELHEANIGHTLWSFVVDDYKEHWAEGLFTRVVTADRSALVIETPEEVAAAVEAAERAKV